MDAFDGLVESFRGLGMSEDGARFAAVGRPDPYRGPLTEAEVRQAWRAGAQRHQPEHRQAPTTLTEAESQVYEAARGELGMPVEQASRYAHERRTAAERKHGTEGARVYLAQLVESIRRIPR